MLSHRRLFEGSPACVRVTAPITQTITSRTTAVLISMVRRISRNTAKRAQMMILLFLLKADLLRFSLPIAIIHKASYFLYGL